MAQPEASFGGEDFYPDLVFTWSNYLYACGPCNGGKNNKFPVISALTGQIVHLPRISKDPVEPEAGEEDAEGADTAEAALGLAADTPEAPAEA